jgi:5-methyltetrahydropteroyltriglutamate--homocysteine methyltransferase
MRSSKDRILTTHAGSLSRPANLIAMGRAGAAGKNKDRAAYANCLADAVADVVCKQRELGIDIPDDGEFGKPVADAYDYGAWWNYAFARMSGFSPAGSPEAAAHETLHKKLSVALSASSMHLGRPLNRSLTRM